VQQEEECDAEKHSPGCTQTDAERDKVSIHGVAKVTIGVPTRVEIDTNFVLVGMRRVPASKCDPFMLTRRRGVNDNVCTGCIMRFVDDSV
tara:strand:+ start:2598 stop:2867 length:270 start_codon:yes stop_codon:yes gene_type:complete